MICVFWARIVSIIHFGHTLVRGPVFTICIYSYVFFGQGQYNKHGLEKMHCTLEIIAGANLHIMSLERVF